MRNMISTEIKPSKTIFLFFVCPENMIFSGMRKKENWLEMRYYLASIRIYALVNLYQATVPFLYPLNPENQMFLWGCRN